MIKFLLNRYPSCMILMSLFCLHSNNSIAQDNSLNFQYKTSVVKDKINKNIPHWDNRVNLNQKSSIQDFLNKKEPLALAAELSGDTFIPQERKKSSGEVYHSLSKKETITFERSKGKWNYFKGLTPEDAKRAIAVTDDEVSYTSEKLFRDFGLPHDEKGEVQAASIVGVGITIGERPKPEMVCKSVRIKRKINGYRVQNSHLNILYTLDGTPFRVIAQWPSFSLRKQAKVISREKAVQDISSVLASRYDYNRIDSALVQLVYRFIEEENIFEPTLVVDVVDEDGNVSPSSIKYSLISGLVTRPEVVAEEED